VLVELGRSIRFFSFPVVGEANLLPSRRRWLGHVGGRLLMVVVVLERFSALPFSGAFLL
jgi:hypothetical protein